jgi:hypothetical protein
LYLVHNGLSVEGVPLLVPLDGGHKSLSHVVEGSVVVLMEGHQVFSGSWGDGTQRSRGGLYGG